MQHWQVCAGAAEEGVRAGGWGAREEVGHDAWQGGSESDGRCGAVMERMGLWGVSASGEGTFSCRCNLRVRHHL